MALKAFYTKIEDAPEAVRNLYVEREGKFWLDAEGVEDVSGLKSALQKEKDAAKDLKAKVADYDELKAAAGDLAALRAKLDEIGDAELLAKGKEGIDELVRRKTERAVADAATRVKAADDARVAAEKAAQDATMSRKGVVLEHAVQAQAVKAGVRATALPDVIRRARDVFDIGDGDKVVPRSEDLIDKRGHVIALDTWFRDVLPDEAPHYWEADKGGGAGGGAGRGAKTISVNDQDAINANIEKIASGEITLV